MKANDYYINHQTQWCPGCGDFGIQLAAKQAFAQLNLPPEKIVMVGGIGCSGKIPHYVRTYGFEGIHGRALPPAAAIKLVNHELEVVVFGGDGDGYGIGMGHFMHALRRNIDFLYVVHNNQIYGLTKGQASPTTEKGYKTTSTPTGTPDEPVNPLAIAIAGGGTWVARGFAGDIKHLTSLMVQGIQHQGFAFLDVLQPCVTYNKLNTFQFFKQRCYKLEEQKDYDPTDKSLAFDAALEWGDRIPIGVFYRVQKPTYESTLPQLKPGQIVKQIPKRDISPLMEAFI